MANAHLNTLINHDAQLTAYGATTPLTEDFYKAAVASCKKMRCLAVNYDLVLPDIPNQVFNLRIGRDGSVQSGSKDSIAFE